MNPNNFFLIVFGLLLVVISWDTTIPKSGWINPPILLFLGMILIAHILEYGPGLWNKILAKIKRKK